MSKGKSKRGKKGLIQSTHRKGFFSNKPRGKAPLMTTHKKGFGRGK